MTVFDSVGFAAGTVRGARTFGVNPDGMLTGIFYHQVWTLGINYARCRSRSGHTFLYYGSFDPEPPAPDTSSEHGMDTCKHGFYAFFDGSNDWHDRTQGRVAGMVEGFGETMIGSRGFRSMKARIVALVVDKVSDEVAAQVAANYQGIPWFSSFETMTAEYPPYSGEA